MEEQWPGVLDVIKGGKAIESLKEKVKEDLFETESWAVLLKEAKDVSISLTRPLFKFLLSKFPTSVSPQNSFFPNKIFPLFFFTAKKRPSCGRCTWKQS